jgi:hypothetical protein
MDSASRQPIGTNVPDISRRFAITAFLASCLLFVVTITYGYIHAYYGHDFFYDVWHCTRWGSDAKHWFVQAFTLDFNLRFHPNYFILKKIQLSLFGFSQIGYIASNLCIHCANAFLVYLLCRRFSATIMASGLAALLFLTSFLSWATVIAATGTARETGLFFYLLGVLAFLVALQTNRPRLSFWSLACLAGSLLTIEDGVTLPVILVTIVGVTQPVCTWLKQPRPIYVTLVLAFAFSITFILATSLAGGDDGYQLYYGWHSLQKILTFPKEVLHALFIPHRVWGLHGFLVLRLIPLVMVFGFSVYLFIRSPANSLSSFLRTNRPLILFSVVFVIVAITPYLQRPSGWTWYNRYLYFPSPGVFLLAGLFGELCYRIAISLFATRVLIKTLMSLVVIYMVTFGTLSSFLMHKDLYFNYGPHSVTNPVDAKKLFDLLSKVRALNPDTEKFIQLDVLHSPFPPGRLRELVASAYSSNVIVLDHGKDIPREGLLAYQIVYQEGNWSEITSWEP